MSDTIINKQVIKPSDNIQFRTYCWHFD